MASLVILALVLVLCTCHFTYSLHQNQSSIPQQPTKPTHITLDFHHSHTKLPVIDFTTWCPTQLEQEELFIVQVNKYKLSFFGDKFRSILVDFMPDTYFLVHTTGTMMKQYQSMYDDIDGIIIYPEALKLSKNVEDYLSLRTTDQTPSQLLIQVGTQGQLQSESSLLDMATFNTKKTRQIDAKYMFTQLQSQSTLQSKQSIFTTYQSTLETFMSTIPIFLHDFQDEYQTAEIDLSNNNEFDDPQSLLQALDIDNVVTEIDTHQIGTIQVTPTRSFLTFFTKMFQRTYTTLEEQNNNINEYISTFGHNTQQLYDFVMNLYQDQLQQFTTIFTTSSTSSKLTSICHDSYTLVTESFIEAGINMNEFISTHNSQSTTKDFKSNPMTSILPFNIVLQQSTMPTSAFIESNVGFNQVRMQLQSPLFMSNTTYLASIIASRISTFDTLFNQIQNQQSNGQCNWDIFFNGQNGQNIGQNAQNCNGTSNTSSQCITIDDIIALLDTQYKTQIYNHNGRHFIYNQQYEQQHEYLTKLNNYQTSYTTRASTMQYIDSLILSMYKSHFTTFQLNNNNNQQQYTLLTQKSMVTTLSALIQFQINTLNHFTSTTLQSILLPQSQSTFNTYMIELDTRLSIFNNYARFALTVGLDNIDINADIPTNMSWDGPYSNSNIRGQNVIVSVADTGADHTSCFLYDPYNAVPFTTSYTTETTSNHRKFKSYYAYADDFDYLNGHGSHVAGSVAGSCYLTTNTMRYFNGFMSEGRLAFVDIAIQGSIIPDVNFARIFQHAKVNGAIITSNSWGSSATKINHVAQNNVYTAANAKGIDQWLYANQDIAALFAAANDGLLAFATLTQQAVSKNVFTIGSTQATKSSGVRAKASNALLEAYNDSPTSFSILNNLYGGTSSCGPRFDHAMKPDFVAPGQSILSIGSNDTPKQTCKTTIKTGTSMATPAISGLLGLIQQMLMEGRINSGTPRSSYAMDKDTIYGPFLKTLLMNGAQRIKYRSNYFTAVPQAMAVQKFSLPSINTGGNEYNHVPMGILGNVAVVDNASTYVYIRPTRSHPYITTTTRTIRIMSFTSCGSFTYTISAYQGTDSTIGTLLKTQNFVYQAQDVSPRTTIEATIPTDAQLYIKITFGVHKCTTKSIIVFIHEFDGPTIAQSQRYQDADCTTKIDDFPLYSAPNLGANRIYVRCPPTPVCTDTFDTSLVRGNRHYSGDSSLCRAALHNGSVNMTLYDLTDVTEMNKIKLSGRKETVMVTDAPPSYAPRIEPKTTWYGVTSQSLDLSTISKPFGFEVTGEPHVDGNEKLYLRKLPPNQNFASGYGLPKLSTILPLTHNADYQNGQTATNTVQRFAAFLATNQPTNIIKDGLSNSKCVFISAKELVSEYRDTYIDSTGQQRYSEVYTSGSDSVRVSLAYYDQPGSPSTTTARLLINDIDLFVYAPDGTEYRGNQRADRLNNAERVDLLEGTFTPGMYCAVTNGVNIPLGPQRYAVVAHGRGIENCLPAVHDEYSGLFSRVDATCSKLTMEDKQSSLLMDYEGNHNLFDLHHMMSDDPEQSLFHKTNTRFQLRQGGDCFAIHDITYASSPTKENDFNAQRLSPTTYEEAKNWTQDSITATASTSSKSTFSISGRIDKIGDLSGYYFKYLKNPNYVDTEPIEDQIPIPVSGTPINSMMMENNIEYLMTASLDATNQQFTMQLYGNNKQCTYTYKRDTLYPPVQYIHSKP